MTKSRWAAWRSPDPYSVVTAAIIAIAVGVIVVPLVLMIARTVLAGGGAEVLRILLQPDIGELTLNTVILIAASSILAVMLGSILAWLGERSDADLGLAGALMPVLPLLIPNVALAIGWVFIADPRVGYLNSMLSALVGAKVTLFNIYSWPGLIWVYAINAIPYVYLVVASALRNLDSGLEEASLISGASVWRTIWRVSLPAVAPAIVASSLLVVIIGFGSYSIPAILGAGADISVIPLHMVRLLTQFYPPRLAEAQLLGTLTLVVVVVLWLVQQRISRNVQFIAVGGRSSSMSRISLGRWRWPCRAIMIAYILGASVLPIIALSIVSVQRYWTPTINLGALTLSNFTTVLFENRLTANAFQNSLLISALGASIAMAIATVAAIYSSMRGNLLGNIVDGALKIPAVVPNLVIALALLVTFAGAPFFLSGSITLLVAAYVVVYIPPGSIAASSTVAQIGKDLREASYISGATEGWTIARVVLPLAVPGLVAGWCIVFVHMVGDLSASSMLAGINSPTIGFVIMGIWETGGFGLLAALAVTICFVVSIVVALSILFGRQYQAKWRG